MLPEVFGMGDGGSDPDMDDLEAEALRVDAALEDDVLVRDSLVALFGDSLPDPGFLSSSLSRETDLERQPFMRAGLAKGIACLIRMLCRALILSAHFRFTSTSSSPPLCSSSFSSKTSGPEDPPADDADELES